MALSCPPALCCSRSDLQGPASLSPPPELHPARLPTDPHPQPAELEPPGACRRSSAMLKGKLCEQLPPQWVHSLERRRCLCRVPPSLCVWLGEGSGLGFSTVLPPPPITWPRCPCPVHKCTVVRRGPTQCQPLSLHPGRPCPCVRAGGVCDAVCGCPSAACPLAWSASVVFPAC